MSITTGAGRRDKRVTIEQPIETRGTDFLDPQNDWETFADVWAAVEPLSGREFLQNREQQTDYTVRVRTLYFPGVNNKMRIVYRDEIFQILSVIDPLEQHEELELMCADFDRAVEP